MSGRQKNQPVEHFYPNSEHYIKVWKQVLGDWLNWKDERIEEFILRWSDWLSGDSGIFFHRMPIEYVSTHLLPAKLISSKKRSLPSRSQLKHLIHDAVFEADRFSHCRDDYDWADAKKRVLKVLKRHGLKLPKPEESAWQ